MILLLSYFLNKRDNRRFVVNNLRIFEFNQMVKVKVVDLEMGGFFLREIMKGSG